MASKSFGPTADIKFGPGRVKEVGKDISVVTLYQYLSSVGTSDPGRVKEVGFFTHSFPGGPILFDTNDDDRSPARVGSDFDGRMKDFNSTNAARWPNMKAAMAVDGRWQIWGCSATVHHKNVTTAAHRHKKDGDSVFFTVTTLAKHHDGRKAQSIEERTTRAGVRVDMDARFRAQTYMAGAAEVLGISVFGAPPGVGASFAQPSLKGSPDLSVMFINVAETREVYAYFKEEFSPQFVPTNTPYDKGYVDYRSFASRPIPSDPPFSSEQYFFSIDFASGDGSASFLGSAAITFANGKTVRIKNTDRVSLKVTSKTNFLTPGRAGHLYELIRIDDKKKSRAVFVQDDQQIVPVLRDSDGNLTIVGVPI